MNDHKLGWFNNEPDKPATLEAGDVDKLKFMLMFKNVHELFIKIHFQI